MSITDHPKINEWLTLVEKEMRNTLARLLAQSVQDCATFLQDKIDIATFNKWLDSYQVNGIHLFHTKNFKTLCHLFTVCLSYISVIEGVRQVFRVSVKLQQICYFHGAFKHIIWSYVP